MRELLDALNFAAVRHRSQRRKGREGAPYVNHLIEVANLLVAHGVTDEMVLVAAVLHDSIEDVGVSAAEIRQRFGVDVSRLVREMTDDPSLPTWQRKLQQIETASDLSPNAQNIRVADKISNLRGILISPPANWSLERKLAYYAWARRVVEGCRSAIPGLLDTFRDVHVSGSTALTLKKDLAG